MQLCTALSSGEDQNRSASTVVPACAPVPLCADLQIVGPEENELLWVQIIRF